MTSAFLALQLWLERPGERIDYTVVPFDQIFETVNKGQADVGLVIHEGQLTFENEGLVCCEDLGVWWGSENDGLPPPLGGNVIHKRIPAAARKVISGVLERSIRYSLEHRAEAVEHSLQYARNMGIDLADKFVGMYVNDWTLDYGEAGRESIRRFLRRGHEMGIVPELLELEFCGVNAAWPLAKFRLISERVAVYFVADGWGTVVPSNNFLAKWVRLG